MNQYQMKHNKTDLLPIEVDTVIYHSPCSDGTASGYIAWKYLSINFPHRQVQYYPMNIGAPPPNNLEGKNVLICDYSYKKNIIENLLTKVNKLLIIDHHKSAEKDLHDIDDKHKIFQLNNSGAMLTWLYFFPNIEPPLMIRYIEDRDIWLKKMPNSDAFAFWFNTVPHNFEEYDKYTDDKLLINMINSKGIVYEEYNNILINQAVEYSVVKFCKIKNKYYFIGIVNSTICKSDIGNRIFNKWPFIDFSIVYNINEYTDSTVFSLRSTPKHVDVSEIAFSIGGGGHKCASGFQSDNITNQLPGIVYDNSKLYKLLDSVFFKTININYVNKNALNIAYLNSFVHKYELSSYLMQKKYTDENGNNITVAENLYKIKNQNKSFSIDMVILYSYHKNINTSKFVIIFNKNIILDIKNELLAKYYTFSGKNNVDHISFSVVGDVCLF